jgi:hypothetical protein
MGVTLNKDGTPRKIGSGKTKGAGCFASIKWQHLKNFIGEEEDIQVSRVWLRSVGALAQKKGSKKKVFSYSQRNDPSPSPTKNSSQPIPPAPPPARPEEEENESEDDYTPPPLFGTGGEIRNY